MAARVTGDGSSALPDQHERMTILTINYWKMWFPPVDLLREYFRFA